jgi:L-ascorbate metabolism protein UlaG (beta-lactamase superfamily)
MEIQALGANTVRINTKKTSILANDSVTGKTFLKDGDIQLFSNRTEDKLDKKVRLFISTAGEYEVADALIVGIPAFPYKEDADHKFSSTIFKIVSDDTSLVIIGDVSPELSDSQIEDIGHADAVVISVGGDSTTLDASQALKIIKKIDPFIVIPVNYEGDLDQITKTLGLETLESTSKYKLKPANFVEGQATKLVLLEKS